MSVPPFRAPHHGASAPAIVGGGPSPRPGEVSLAHRGVLFLDELPEFPRSVLESLRQPLEDGFVAVARVGGHAIFPARFQLVGTMNMCPCGGRGDPAVECACSPQRLAAYREKLSRALLDRFDLAVAMPRPRAAELAAPQAEASAEVRERVLDARDHLLRSPPRRTDAASELLSSAVDRLPLSGRGRARVARVARTIAALAARLVGRAGSRRRGALVPDARRARGEVTVIRCIRRRDRVVPAAARRDPRSAARLFLRGCCGRGAPRPAGGRSRRRASVLVVRSLGRALACARARCGRSRRRERHGARHRRRGPSGGARGRRRDGGRARLRHRPRLSGRALPSSRDGSARAGLVVSEYEPGVEPAPWRFPARNRIIAGLCRATVVSRRASAAAP